MASSSSTFNFQVPGQVADDVKVFIVTIENREIHKPHLYSTPPPPRGDDRVGISQIFYYCWRKYNDMLFKSFR